jgi:hypothetical protein
MENKESNPNTNQPSDNTGAPNKVFGSSEEFFGRLESDVNGAIDDSVIDQLDRHNPVDTRNESPIQNEGPPQATPQSYMDQGNSNSNIDWEKRYKDSSTEAVKLSARLKKLQSFEPLMQVMRKDEGLVKHIKDYLSNGGAPAKSVKEELGLKEDFHYDPNEAIEDPKSDSAKVFKSQVDKAVESKVGQVVQQQSDAARRRADSHKLISKAKEYKEKYNLTGKQLQATLKLSAEKKLSFDDAYLLLNRDQQKRNISSDVRKEAMAQMQNARNIPRSASSANSAQVEKNPTDAVFDSMARSDDDVDNLFG